LVILALSQAVTYAATLTSQTAAAFDRYIELAEAQMNANLAPEHFLRIDGKPDWQTEVREGQTRIEPGAILDNGKKINVPGGMIQHWIGTIFVAGATIPQVKAVLQDYEHYKVFYRPDVTESRQIAHQGDDYEIFLRLYKKQVITVVLNTTYKVRYATLDPQRMSVVSRSTRITEARDWRHPDAGEEPVGDDHGFLWRLNSYWRFEQSAGGVFAECQAISLSRDVPALLVWIKGFLERFPKDSMLNTLRGTKAAVLKATSPGGSE
jgi:hypothetical protein